jgi:predicted RecA/RadA family phage recombinase
MATNREFADGDQLAVVVTHPTTPNSGDPVRVGALCGVALTDEDEDTGLTTVQFDGVFRLSVTAATAITPGSVIHYDDAAGPGTGVLSNDATGSDGVIGVSLDSLASGTDIIRVKLRNAV